MLYILQTYYRYVYKAFYAIVQLLTQKTIEPDIERQAALVRTVDEYKKFTGDIELLKTLRSQQRVLVYNIIQQTIGKLNDKTLLNNELIDDINNTQNFIRTQLAPIASQFSDEEWARFNWEQCLVRDIVSVDSDFTTYFVKLTSYLRREKLAADKFVPVTKNSMMLRALEFEDLVITFKRFRFTSETAVPKLRDLYA